MIVKMRCGMKDKRFCLKSCPFCGENKAVFRDCKELQGCDSWEHCREDGMIAVVCDFTAGGCGASSGYRETYEEAATAWNMRLWGSPETSDSDGQADL